jgi:hypothetical protein
VDEVSTVSGQACINGKSDTEPLNRFLQERLTMVHAQYLLGKFTISNHASLFFLGDLVFMSCTFPLYGRCY